VRGAGAALVLPAIAGALAIPTVGGVICRAASILIVAPQRVMIIPEWRATSIPQPVIGVLQDLYSECNR
jgi:hypothetical protein